MLSRADARSAIAPIAPIAATSVEGTLRSLGALLHGVGLLCMALLLWHFLTPEMARRDQLRVGSDGRLNESLAALVSSASDTIDVQLRASPDARTRAVLRALRGSGRRLQLTSERALTPVAVSVQAEWRASGGTRVQTVGADSVPAVIGDGAGIIESAILASAGTQFRTGPVQGVLRVGTGAASAAASPVVARAPQSARVLVVGEATWESRFLIAALEEAGWPVDAAVSLSPKVTVTSGSGRVPSRDKQSIVVLLPGASRSTMGALPDFVSMGGGLVIVGDAARSAGLASLRAGSPGATIAGEVGAESGTDARQGLDLVPIATLVNGGVPLELRNGRIAIAARRVGAGRVVQVGYQNSWLWRMAGNDDAPLAHRRWWTDILSGVVPQTAPMKRLSLDAEHDTLDAAPIAALARDVGIPRIRPSSVRTTSRTFIASLDPRWLLGVALLSMLASWLLRRWRGLK